MSAERPAKRVRLGAKSCVECRRRKVRCIWPTPVARICEFCQSRDLKCEQQVTAPQTDDTIRVTTRARLAHLERNISDIWAAIQNLQAGPALRGPVVRSLQSSIGDDEHDDVAAETSSESSEELSPPNAPTHLLQLFDNHLLGLHSSNASPAASRLASGHKTRGSPGLRALLPSRRDMLSITQCAVPWLGLYSALFPMLTLNKTAKELMTEYDRLQDPNDDLIALAELLLAVALTIQQAPEEVASSVGKSVEDTSSLMVNIGETVERAVIADDNLVRNVPGIRLSILYIRFLLGFGKVTKLWLLLRRVIALAELIGLSRASLSLRSHQNDTQSANEQPQSATISGSMKLKAELWEALCALDRISSMMWSLPLATSNSHLPKRPIIDEQGHVSAQSYLYSLADIASRILDLDNISSTGRTQPELFNAVMQADYELRSLADQPPRTWWHSQFSSLSMDAILQLWHQYILVRAHLRLALEYDENKQQYALSFMTCLGACQEVASRYAALRPTLPPGFFAIWVVDLQGFTSAVYLLLASHRITRGGAAFPQAFDVTFVGSLVDQVIRNLDSARGRAGEEFSRRAAKAIRSLRSLLREPQASEAQNISLSLPLVGNIQISRKSGGIRPVSSQDAVATLSTASTVRTNQEQQTASQTGVSSFATSNLTLPDMQLSAEDMDYAGSLSYSMEIPEFFPVLSDDIFSNDQWLLYTD